jgi:mono/diheme cytochrome c family protein
MKSPPEKIRTSAPGSEEPEATAGSGPLPVWLAVLSLLLFSGILAYVGRHDGDFSADVYEPFRSPTDLERANRAPGEGLTTLGRGLYTTKGCLACHQANGQGITGQFPPLAGSEWVLAPEPGRLIRIVLNGAQGAIQVKGMAFANVMFPLRDRLTDEELAAVLTYIRRAWGNSAPEVTAKRVEDVREKTKDQIGPWNPADLLKVPESD